MSKYIGVDLSTKTGFVVLDELGSIIVQDEIKASGDGVSRMSYYTKLLMNRVEMYEPEIVCVEGFSYSSKGKGVDFQYGIGWLIRVALYESGIQFYEVAPSALKKFAGAKGNAGKEQVAVAVYRNWNMEFATNNITDAYVLAQVARHIGEGVGGHKYQADVLKTVVQN